MTIIKQVIEGISKPLAYIWNLSFQRGTFSDQMKAAKVIPFYKTGNKHNFTNLQTYLNTATTLKDIEKAF